MALKRQRPFGGGLTKMRPWAPAYFPSVTVLNFFNFLGAHIVQKSK